MSDKPAQPMAANTAALAAHAIEACRRLAEFTEVPGTTMRTFLSPPMRQAHAYLRAWMERLGMAVRVDAAGNLRGVYAGRQATCGRLLIGSHLDTVPDAGAFDGVLGVVLGLALVESLAGEAMEFAIEVIAFSEEEGVRFGVPFIGSRALVGNIDDALLALEDKEGVTVRQAMSDFGLDTALLPGSVADEDAFAYVEFHIEQGPVLEDLGLSLGIVEAIAGQTRLKISFKGKANHAGTTPMRLRRDALAGAAEWMVAVERKARCAPGLVATIGQIEARPGAGNVIPGETAMSLDVRHADDAVRTLAVESLLALAESIAAERGLLVASAMSLEQAAVPMDAKLTSQLEEAMNAAARQAHRMTSGAGHDAMVMARKIPSAMLFLRSPGGTSHHPDESVLQEDAEAALAVGYHLLRVLNDESMRRLL